MKNKPDIVVQYERQKAAGESLYFDPVELDEIFHYYAEENDWDGMDAVMKLTKELHPTDFVTVTLEAEYALNSDQPAKCLELLEPIFSDDNPLHHILRSGALAKLNRVTEAISYAERAMEFDDPYIAYDLGLGFMNADQFSVALRYYSRCLDRRPDDVRSIIGILYCLGHTGSAEEVLRYADRALEIDSFCIEAWIAKGGVLMEEEKWAEAEECYDYALAIHPDHPDCLVMKSRCCMRLNRPIEAMQMAQEAAEHADNEQQANIYLYIAEMKSASQQQKEAVDYVWKAVMANPDDVDLMERAAVCFADYSEPDACVTILEGLLQQEGDNVSPYMVSLLCEQYTHMGRALDAIALYERLIDKYPSASVYTMMAGAYISISKFRKAYKMLQKANEDEIIWQTYILMTVCAHELGWKTAMVDNYIMAHCLSATDAKGMLKTVSPQLAEQFEKDHVFEEAEKWRLRHLEAEIERVMKKSKTKK